jgi:hypothetical protein
MPVREVDRLSQCDLCLAAITLFMVLTLKLRTLAVHQRCAWSWQSQWKKNAFNTLSGQSTSLFVLLLPLLGCKLAQAQLAIVRITVVDWSRIS